MILKLTLSEDERAVLDAARGGLPLATYVRVVAVRTAQESEGGARAAVDAVLDGAAAKPVPPAPRKKSASAAPREGGSSARAGRVAKSSAPVAGREAAKRAAETLVPGESVPRPRYREMAKQPRPIVPKRGKR